MLFIYILSVYSGIFIDSYGVVMLLIYVIFIFVQLVLGQYIGYEYFCSGNFICYVLEMVIVDLENGMCGYVFVFGLVVIFIVLELLDKDSYLVVVDDVYGGIYCLLENVCCCSVGLQVSWVKFDDLVGIEVVICFDMCMIWVEMFINLLLKFVDFSVIVVIVCCYNLISVVDNIFVLLVIYCLLEYGFDIVVYFVIKYFNGYFDVVVGLVVVGDNFGFVEKFGYLQNVVGGVFDLFSSFLMLCGICILVLWMECYSVNVLQFVEWLEQQLEVE